MARCHRISTFILLKIEEFRGVQIFSGSIDCTLVFKRCEFLFSISVNPKPRVTCDSFAGRV